MPHTYRAHAHRESGGWWTIEVPELTSPGPDGKTITATGGAITTRGIDQAARELIAAWLDIDTTDVSVHVTVKAPEDILRLWKQGTAAETDGRATIEHGATLRREAIRSLRAQGYTAEATAAAFGISRQRVHQLENQPTPNNKQQPSKNTPTPR